MGEGGAKRNRIAVQSFRITTGDYYSICIPPPLTVELIRAVRAKSGKFEYPENVAA